MAKRSESHPQLMRLFRKFNAKYFGGQLPEPIIKYEHLTEMKCFGLCEHIADDIFVITIDPQFASLRAFRHITLLHEMIHIAIWPYASHGKKFEEEVIRLCIAGAYKDVL